MFESITALFSLRIFRFTAVWWFDANKCFSHKSIRWVSNVLFLHPPHPRWAPCLTARWCRPTSCCNSAAQFRSGSPACTSPSRRSFRAPLHRCRSRREWRRPSGRTSARAGRRRPDLNEFLGSKSCWRSNELKYNFGEPWFKPHDQFFLFLSWTITWKFGCLRSKKRGLIYEIYTQRIPFRISGALVKGILAWKRSYFWLQPV